MSTKINQKALFHEIDSPFCFPLSKNKMVVRLRVDKDNKFEQINLVYGGKYDYYLKQKRLQMSLKFTTSMYAIYEVVVELLDVRFVYIFELLTKKERAYFSEDGLTKTYDFAKAYLNCFQYPYINENDIVEEIPWVKNAVFYQIFVDRFNNGSPQVKKDFVTMKWNDLPRPGDFAGGDLAGIIEKLPYLSRLGINCIYLTPIFSSISYHKYDINDYYKVDSQLGDEKLLKALVDKAHSLGIKVLLDGVFNHTSDLLAQFDDVCKLGKDSRYFDWFIIKGDKVDKKLINYETFSNCYYHPKFNTANEEVQQFLIDIATHYIKKFDIDGWRLDVSDEPSHAFWKKLRIEVKKVKSDAYLVGENWHNARSFCRGDEFDGILNYRFTKIAVEYIALNQIDAQKAQDYLVEMLMRNVDQTNKMNINLLDSHDTDRFINEASNNVDKLITALAFMFILPGAPLVYYGSEIALMGGYDPDNRRCMDFTKIDEDSKLFQTIVFLANLRKAHVLIEGTTAFEVYKGALVITRKDESKTLTLYINATPKAITVNSSDQVLFAHNSSDFTINPNGFILTQEVV